MAVQSEFYSGSSLTIRTFPSSKHIATKSHMAIWRHRIADGVWVEMDASLYELINNACVLNSVLNTSLYDQLEVRVADTPDELTESPSDIATVASISTEIITVVALQTEILVLSGIATEIASLYADKATLDSLYADKATLDSLYADKATLDSLYADKATLDSLYADKATLDSLFADKATLDSLFADKATLDSLFADKATLDSLYADKATLDSLYADKATLDSLYSNLADMLEANLRAWEAEAERLTAESYATEAEDVPVNIVTSNGDGTFTYTPTSPAEYSALHWAAKAETFNPDSYVLKTEEKGFKNHIINGAFQINQYADIDTAPVSVSNNIYKIDRFINSINTITATMQRLSEQAVNNYKVNTVKYLATSTGTGWFGQYQKIENLFKGETKTLSIWVKSNNANARIDLYDGVTHSYSTPHSGAGDWELLTVTKTISASATVLQAFCRIISNTSTAVSITTGDYIESTMWQLESGSVATPFEQRPVGLELSLCQRYYQKTTDPIQTTVYATNTDYFYTLYQFKTTMRSTPTVVVTGVAASGFDNNPTVGTSYSDEDKVTIYEQATATGYGYYRFSLTADAEL